MTPVTTKKTTGPLSWPAEPRHELGPWGAEPPLSDIEAELRPALRKFAVEVMRPVGQRIDRMTPDEIIAKSSPIWEFHKKFLDLQIDISSLLEMPPLERSRLFCIIFEELGYGDGGLAGSAGLSMLGQYMPLLFGNQALAERFPREAIGCLGVTEPDHGTDMLDPNGMLRYPGAKYGKPNCVARLYKDKIVVNGQKSSWVSNGPIADWCLLYCAADIGDGPDPAHGCVIMMPLDLAGVSRSKPVEKIGQRTDPQGELFFNDVEVPIDCLMAGPEDYQRAVYCIHAQANVIMGAMWNGVARGAYDLAYNYVHERKQGGVPIIKHQLTAYRLFNMFREIEASVALTRRVAHYNESASLPALQAAMSAKVTATDVAFRVSSEALGLHGGNGITHAYPIEKIMRDCRVAMIEDCTNEILTIKGGYYLADPHRL